MENRLEQEVSVQEVSFAADLLSASDEYTDFGRGYRENNVQFKVFVVSPDFLRLMNIPVISGRDFLQEDSKSVGGVYLFNEAARLQYDLVAGEYITGNEWYEAPPALIAGFIDDIKYASFRTEVAPMAFLCFACGWVSAEVCLYQNKGGGGYPGCSGFDQESLDFDR